MTLSDFDYHLPDDLIAQKPPAERDAARMLVLHRAAQTWEDRQFRDLPEYLSAEDCLVVNDSRVLPSRLYGHRGASPGAIELMLLEPASADSREWRALARPGKKLRPGDILHFDNEFAAE